ncbi:bacterio-opsin activator [Paenibacillus sp. FSL R10-2736]|uniref:bacterio-opsin activator n=1 Tax=Paenibacillus sp. FSL R10-2736 TaxID=2954692 RepID=UPI0030F73595
MNLSSANSKTSAQRIVGFGRERNAFSHWLAAPDAGSQIFSVTGIGGIGKTTLLTEMNAEACRSSTLTIWMDGQICLQTPGAFLSYLEMSLEMEYGLTRAADETMLTYAVRELTRQRTVLIIDNCEHIDYLESWLLASLLPRLAEAECLLILASRRGLPTKWHCHPFWSRRIHSYPLELFSREEIYEYLQDSGFSPALQLDIVHKTEGHPLLLALTLDMLLRQEPERQEREYQLPGILSAEMLKEAASPFMYEALQLLSLLPAADQTILNQLLASPLSASDYAELSRLSCVRTGLNGLCLHQLVSRMLREDFQRRDPGQYHRMRSRMLELLTEKFPASNTLQQMQIAAHMLELYREQLPVAGTYTDFTAVRSLERQRGYEPGDLPYLHRFLEASLAQSDWQSELIAAGEHQPLLDDIAAHDPDSIVVLCDSSGIPLGFSAGLRLHALTLSLLDRYAPSHRDLLGELAGPLHTLPAEAADTLFILLAAVDTEQPYYRPEELGAMLLQSWLVYTSGGLRTIVATADNQLNLLLPLLGFQERIQSRLEPDVPAMLTVWDLDFRKVTFEVWVQRVFQLAVQVPEADLPLEPQILDWKDVKQIVQHLYIDTLLEEIPFVQRLGLAGGSVRLNVQHILTDTQPPYPLTELEQSILRESYLQKNYRKSQLAEAFHMSRTTFYRHSRLALIHLGHVLTRMLRDNDLHGNT